MGAKDGATKGEAKEIAAAGGDDKGFTLVRRRVAAGCVACAFSLARGGPARRAR
jgi:hypothetical protein